MTSMTCARTVPPAASISARLRSARSGSISAISTERAVLGEQPRDRAADAVTAAGDDSDLAVEQPVPVFDLF